MTSCMLSLCFLFSSVLLSTQNDAKSSKSEWHIYTSDTHKYKIDFTAKPTGQNQTIPSEIGPLNLAKIMYNASIVEDENFLYMVNYTEYPVDTIHSDLEATRDQKFRGAVDGAVANVGGKLISEEPIEVNNFPGRKIKVEF